MVHNYNHCLLKHCATFFSFVYSNDRTASTIKTCLVVLGSGSTLVIATHGVADAGGLDFNNYARSVSTRTDKITDIVTYISYIGGAILTALGIVDLKKHVEQPTQVKMKDGLAKLGFGGMLLALPFLAGVVQGTMKDGNQAQFAPWQDPPRL